MSRSTIKTTLGAAGDSKLAEQLREKVLAPLPRAPIEDKPAKRKRGPSLYDSSAKPLVPDPLGAVVHGNVNPDTVLAKIRGVDGHVSQMSIKTASRPIDYLRTRSAKPIDSEQFAAAERFLIDREATGRVPSNTATTITHMQNSVPWSQRDYDLKESGDLMPYGTEVKIPKDTSDGLLQAAWRVRRITEKLPTFERSLLEDLVIREYPVGVIGQRWGWSPDAASEMVRLALWRLVSAYVETDSEFRSWIITERLTAEQGG